MAVLTTLDLSKARFGIANRTLGKQIFDVVNNGEVFVDKTITTAQLLALNATPQELVAAPGANIALIFAGALIRKPAGTAYAGIAAGEDLSFKYTNAAGAEVGQVETVGFLDSTANQLRWGEANKTSLTPVANAALVLHLLVGEIITGNSDLIVRTFFRTVKTDLS